MRKLLSTVAAIAFAGGVAYATNIPLFSGPGPAEPSQLLAVINQLISAINSGTPGLGGYGGLAPGPVGNNAGTTPQSFAIAYIPTGALTAAGQGFRAHCAGISGQTTNADFMIQVGYLAGTAVGATLTTVASSSNWDLELTFQAATNPVTANNVWSAKGLAGAATGNAQAVTTSLLPQVAVNSGNDTTVTDNNVNFALPVRCMYLMPGIATATVTMESFTIEQVK